MRLERTASDDTRRVLGKTKFAIQVDVKRNFEVDRVVLTTEQPITTKQELILRKKISTHLEVRQEVVKVKVGPVPPPPPPEAPAAPEVPVAPGPAPQSVPGKPTPP